MKEDLIIAKEYSKRLTIMLWHLSQDEPNEDKRAKYEKLLDDANGIECELNEMGKEN